jgi:ankyrin repeat protein
VQNATKYGNVKLIRSFVKYPMLNHNFWHGTLLKACTYGHIDIAKLLVDSQLASVNNIPLVEDIVKHPAIVRFIIDHSNNEDYKRYNKLYYAALLTNEVDSLKIIISDGRVLHGRISSSLIYNEQPVCNDIARLVLMYPHAITTADDYFRFKAALKYQLYDVVEYLHKIQDVNVTSCLVEACKRGDLDVVNQLLQSPRIDILRLNEEVIDTCLRFCEYYPGPKFQSVLKAVLLDNRSNSSTAFDYAIEKHNINIVDFILSIQRFRTAENLIKAISLLQSMK